MRWGWRVLTISRRSFRKENFVGVGFGMYSSMKGCWSFVGNLCRNFRSLLLDMF